MRRMQSASNSELGLLCIALRACVRQPPGKDRSVSFDETIGDGPGGDDLLPIHCTQ
jgi:hypothetical protein